MPSLTSLAKETWSVAQVTITKNPKNRTAPAYLCTVRLPLPFSLPKRVLRSYRGCIQNRHMIVWGLRYMYMVVGRKASCDQPLEEKGQCKISTLPQI